MELNAKMKETQSSSSQGAMCLGPMRYVFVDLKISGPKTEQ